MKPARQLFQRMKPQSPKETKTSLILLGLLVSLWCIVSFSSVAFAQDALPVVNGGWPAGLQYTVRPGDTLLSVSLEMGMDLDQVSCLISRAFRWEQPLVIGQTLTVPDSPFICHPVQEGESLAAIAARYGISVTEIAAEPWNQLGPENRIRYLRIPLSRAIVSARPSGTGGELSSPQPRPVSGPLPAYWPYGSGNFAWPVYGWITQDFRPGHSAIDVAAWAGTPVTAADRGVVIRAGWSEGGYGNFVVVDHKIDYITLYAHLGEIFVVEGQVVAQGQLIGTVGSTGNSTGPHLHFEIRDFGQRVNPLGLLGQ